MLDDLFTGETRQQVQSGMVAESLLDGRFRVTVSGRSVTAANQSGMSLSVGSVVSVAAADGVYRIVSAAGKTAISAETIMIRG